MSKIAILGAMVEEVEPIIAKLEDKKRVSFANNIYYEGRYEGKEVVVAYSKIGKVFASLTASVMIEHFGCDKLLFSGVAGAINSDLNIGDLIYATKLCQHDLDITAFGHPYGFVPEGSIFTHTTKELNDLALQVAKEQDIKLQHGIIATGDQFVASSETKEWIQSTFSADALEMEGASVAVVCDAYNVPFFILRAISDAADVEANFDFDEFLQKSAKVSAEFILNMVAKIDD
ncbi:MAG: 5'-methylthioadenosine/adenosylhomocysteine nucleosidase [Campylobacterota bacterium]